MTAKKSSGWAAAALVLSMTLGLQSPMASADPNGDAHHHDDAIVVDDATAERNDIEIIAETYGWSLPATRQHMQDQHEFGELIESVSKQHPRRYLSAVFAEYPGGPSLIRFKGAVPQGVAAEADETGLDVRLAGGYRINELELREQTSEVTAALVADGFTGVVASAMPDGTIEVSVQATASGLEPKLPAHLRRGVRLQLVSGAVTEDYSVYGGGRVTGGSTCTSGFTVESFAGVEGVATAAHCTGINTYTTGVDHDLDWAGEHIGLFGDVEWHTSDEDEPDDYYARSNEIRDVSSVETYPSIAVNNVYCLYGRTSNNRQCDDVRSTYVDGNFPSGWAASLVSMDNNNMTNGDSGGPVSYSTEAAGIIKGSVWNWFKYRDVWSVADLFPVSIGVYVKTSP